MDENKKSLLIHYITEFILGSIGIGIFVILLYFNEFDLSLNIVSLWVFLYNGILFTYWIWKSDAKIWEKLLLVVTCSLLRLLFPAHSLHFTNLNKMV